MISLGISVMEMLANITLCFLGILWYKEQMLCKLLVLHECLLNTAVGTSVACNPYMGKVRHLSETLVYLVPHSFPSCTPDSVFVEYTSHYNYYIALF